MSILLLCWSCGLSTTVFPPCSHEGMGHGKHDWDPVLEIPGHSWQCGHCKFSSGIQNVVKFSRWLWKALNVRLNLLGSVFANRVSSFCHEDVLWEFLWFLHSFCSSCYMTHDHEEFGCHLEIVGSQSLWWKDRLLQQVKEWPLLVPKSCHVSLSCTDCCGWSWTSELEHRFYVEIFGPRVTCVIHCSEKLFPLLRVSPSLVGERTNSGQAWFKSCNEKFKGSKFSRQPSYH